MNSQVVEGAAITSGMCPAKFEWNTIKTLHEFLDFEIWALRHKP